MYTQNTQEGKATDEDGITTEMYKALGDLAVEKLTLMFNKIYSTPLNVGPPMIIFLKKLALYATVLTTQT